MNRAMFSSDSAEWETPQDLFDRLDAAFRFTLDVCATAQNAKCFAYFDKAHDGLGRSWAKERCWMNPPYGREIGRWVQKAAEEAEKGALVVALLPARTDTRWWQEWAMRGDIHFIKGRLKFGGAKAGAPFPSAIVVFWPKP